METIEASPRFLALLDELDRFQLPARSRILPGEIVGGRIKANMQIIPSGAISASTPAPTGAIVAKIAMRASARDRLTYAEIVKANAPMKLLKAPRKPAKAARAPRKPSPAPKLPRTGHSAEVKAVVSAKARAKREARVAAVLPLIAQAREQGCLLLSEIGQYLDQRGHKPPQGEKWSTASLSRIIGPISPEDRQRRDERFAKLIADARADGAISNAEIADWLNERGHRTEKGAAWTGVNVSRFRRTFEVDREAHLVKLASLVADAIADGAISYVEIAGWLNARDIKTVNGTVWSPANVGFFKRGRMQTAT
ncbi:hypothetical protein EWE75_23980 [Sphingomonas populi]|uniref:Recombinase domain-containing protein n=1 Tax=Sphingomonas populi TaxID=2484750 RepID=A0A4Q6XHH8_9SPHN|nr:hypothetical protein [Sphingomonas populi]RZF59043.1 hypothetical protein EWE75_23980 [Sphingomonas populi]